MFSMNEELGFPWEVEWSITWACNVNCYFCSTGEYDRKLYSNYTDIVSKKIIEAHPLTITLSGGEPLVHPKIEKILDTLVSSNIPVNITTNGISLNKIDQKILSKLNWIRVSLHSGINKTSKVIMGNKYNLEKVIENINKLSKITNRFSLFFILTKENSTKEELCELLNLSKYLGVNNVEVGIIKLLGLANKSMLEDKNLIAEIIDYLRIEANKLGISIKLPDIYQDKHVCIARSRNISIFPDGSVRSCSFDNDVSWGNIFHESLIDIWKKHPYLNDWCDRCNPGGYQSEQKRLISIKNI